jgi:hypothetical protein
MRLSILRETMKAITSRPHYAFAPGSQALCKLHHVDNDKTESLAANARRTGTLFRNYRVAGSRLYAASRDLHTVIMACCDTPFSCIAPVPQGVRHLAPNMSFRRQRFDADRRTST